MSSKNNKTSKSIFNKAIELVSLIGADVLEKQKEIKDNAKKTRDRIEQGAKPRMID